jgi:glycosyltransferase involved in cell wall biosynthesis
VARVALVCEPPDGGVAEHVRRLVLGLPAHGHAPRLIVAPEFAHLAELRAAGADVRTARLRRDYRHPAGDARALAEIVRAARGADVVHAHSAKAGVLGRLAAAALRRPAVYTPHGLPFVGEMSAARRRFGVVTERALAPATAALICVCGFERDLARASGLRPRRVAVVHNGCPACAGEVPVAPELAALRARGPVVGAVSTLRPAKRLDVLLAAAPAVLAAVPEASVVIAGEGPEEAALRAQAARLGLAEDPRLAFLPFAAPTARYLRGLDVYVLSSGWEAFPIGPLEAQACGVPQVVSAVGGTAEAVVPETGLLVPPRDPGALAEAIVALLRDPARRARMAAASRARHAERFTVERMVAATAAVYAAVLG